MSKKLLDTNKKIRYTTTCKEKNFTGGVFMLQEIQEKNTDALSHRVELSLLFDFYGSLLKENKREIFEDYVLNDYSLSEIAAERGMSRQGVHDTVKRCSKELERYEEILHLIEKFRKTKEHVNQIHEIAMDIRESRDVQEIEKIEILSNQILDML